tara:strand:+ start:1774 stop:2745 length:972 start_codon:yes stop_codon:yes gene_type:complete
MSQKIKKAVIEVCGSCNYKCEMCPQAWGREKTFKRMLNYDLYVDLLDQLLDHDLEEIYLEGSGEPFMNKKLHDFVKAGTDRGFKMCFITNGSLMTGDKMKKVIDAGMHFARVSITGYNKELYKKWMSKDWFDKVMDNTKETLDYIKQSGSSATIGSYHLIIDNDKMEYEIEQYKKNWIDKLPGIKASIWKMHNWSGVYDDVQWRHNKFQKKRSCGRPFSPDLIVRAGGNDGNHGAIVPCCMVLGQDSKAVLGHLSENSLNEIWTGDKYEHLREMHRQHRFDEIDYCKNCDMLYEAPEALVWSNFETSYHILTGGLFDMRQYRI